MRYRKDHGFTLIELLVVIAVISVLAALLMPALRNAMETSRQIQCMNTMKQVGLIHQFYANDYDGYSVYGWQDAWIRSGGILESYGGDALLSKSQNSSGFYAHCPSESVTNYGSYCANNNMIGGTSGRPRRSILFSSVRYPSQAVLSFECVYGGNGGYQMWKESNTFYLFSHQGKMNFLYLDWHVDSYRREELRGGWEEWMVFDWDNSYGNLKP